jgi:hypothetical protein
MLNKLKAREHGMFGKGVDWTVPYPKFQKILLKINQIFLLFISHQSFFYYYSNKKNYYKTKFFTFFTSIKPLTISVHSFAKHRGGFITRDQFVKERK